MTTSSVDLGRWIRRFHPSSGKGPRLLCLPHAGGSASFFFKMSALLAPDIEVVAVQYPGRQKRRHEPYAGSIGELAAAVASLPADWLDRPYALFGHSMGSLVGFEAARILSDAGAAPGHLIVSGRCAPSIPRFNDVHRRDDGGLLAELSSLGGTDVRLLADPEVREMLVGPTRADYRAVETYVYEPGLPLTCPVTILTGTEDPNTTVEEAAAWSDHTASESRLLTFPGGHFFLEQQREAVAAAIRDALRALV